MPRPKRQTTSPVVLPNTDKTLFNFETAIAKIKDGKKVTKVEWNNPEYYGVLADGFLMLHKPDGKLYQWLVSDGDMLGEDWVLL